MELYISYKYFLFFAAKLLELSTLSVYLKVVTFLRLYANFLREIKRKLFLPNAEIIQE